MLSHRLLGFGLSALIAATGCGTDGTEIVEKLPVVLDLSDTKITVAEDEVHEFTIESKLTGATGDLAYEIETQPSHGKLEIIAGGFRYTPDPDYFGEDSVAIGGSIAGKSASATVDITVTPVNDPPSFVPGNAVVVDEDAGPQSLAGWATEISAGPDNEDASQLAFTLSVDNAALFAEAPSLSVDGTLTFTTAPDAFGQAEVQLSLGDGEDETELSVFTITATPVNDAPVFVAGGDVTVNEDAGPQSFAAWATGISAGPDNEDASELAFTVTVDNEALFAEAPALSTDGTLTFTSAPDAFGEAEVSVSLSDGEDEAELTIFTITVNPNNEAPSFTPGANIVVQEDSGVYSATWATSIDPGAGESSQSVTFSVTNDHAALFAEAPAIGSGGLLTFRPADDAFGSANVIVVAWDNGGTENGGIDHSASVEFTITVEPVNDAPSFTATTSSISVGEDSGAYAHAGWALTLSAGNVWEAAQPVAFVLTNSNPALFASAPTVSTTGTLSFTPAPNAFGSATLGVRLKDADGALSGSTTLTITITAFNDAPTVPVTDVTVLEDAGAFSQSGWTTITAGPNEGTQSITSVGTTNDNNALFSVQPNLTAAGELTFTPADDAFGEATVTVTVTDNGPTGTGHVNTAQATFKITVTPVNDAPTITIGGVVNASEDASPHGEGGWATGISAGPSNEAAQAITISTWTDHPEYFTAGPTLDLDGALYFELTPDAYGDTTLYVQIVDDGGTENSGVDRSEVYSTTLSIAPVNDAPTPAPDMIYALEGHPLNVDVLANDTDPEGDELFVVAADCGGNGVAVIEADGTVTFTPAAAVEGSYVAACTYDVSDGDLSVTGVQVTMQVNVDYYAPELDLSESKPTHGALLTWDEAFTDDSLNGHHAELSPAVFVFDDYNFDGSTVGVAVTFAGASLVEDADFFVDTNTPRTVKVTINPASVGSMTETGDALVFTLTGIQDTKGNFGDDVVVAVVLDQVAPVVNFDSYYHMPNARLLATFSETMDAPAHPFAVMTNETDGTNVQWDMYDAGATGAAWLTATVADDTFYQIPAELLEEGKDYLFSVAAFTDLAGNPVGTSGEFRFSVCCTQLALLDRIEFVNPGDDSVVATVTAAELVNDAFVAPASLTDTTHALRLVFTDSLTSNADWTRLRAEFEDDGYEALPALETVTLTDDALRFNPADLPAWTSEASYVLGLNASSGSGVMNTTIRFAFVDDDDTTAPAINAFVSRSGQGTVPIISPSEALGVVFSEQLDPRLGDDSFSITDGSETWSVVVESHERDEAGFWIRAASGGKPIALADGTYWLELDGVADPSGNTMPAMAAYPFQVATLPVSPVNMIMSMPSEGMLVNTNQSITLYFDQSIAQESAVDTGTGPRGFRLEEQLDNGAWVPVKGLSVEVLATGASAMIELSSQKYSVLRDETTYRLSLLGDLQTIDGAAYGKTTSIEFTTGGDTNMPANVDGYSVELFAIPPSFSLNFGPDPLQSNAVFGLWFSGEADTYTHTIMNLDLGTMRAVTDTSALDIELDATGISDMLVAGAYNLVLDRLEDTAGNFGMFLHALYRYSDNVAFATPSVVDNGGGNYSFSGTIANPDDAAATSHVNLIVALVDTSVSPNAIVSLGYRGAAMLNRSVTGELHYAHDMPADVSLPPAPVDHTWMVLAEPVAWSPYGNGRAETNMLSLPASF